MTTKNMEKVYESATEKRCSKFTNFATYIVDSKCRNFDGTPLMGDQRSNAIEVLCLDMGSGSEYTKNQYIALGALIGVTVCGLSILTYNKFIKKTKEES